MNRKGFTLIELLIVVVIIGILAAIAIPKFANTKAKAYIASMKSDLRNLVTAEEAYFADSVKYSATTACTTPPTAGAVNFCVTTGNNLGTIGLAAGNGRLGRDDHEQQPDDPAGEVRDLHQHGGVGTGGHGRRPRLSISGSAGMAITSGGAFPAASFLCPFPPSRSARGLAKIPD